MMSSPAVSGVDADLSSQGLSYGRRDVTGPAELAVPPPDAAGVVGAKTLVAVTAARPVGPDTLLDPTSAVDLTGAVDGDGLVHWSVPPGRWLVFAFWRRPSRQLPNSLYGLSLDANLDAVAPNFDGLLTVDPFNPGATRAALDWLHRNAIPGGDGQLYEDSLEYYYGTHSTPWTLRFLDEFRARRGYALTRLLPALFVADLYTFWKSGATIGTSWPGWNPWAGVFSEPWNETWPQWHGRLWSRSSRGAGGSGDRARVRAQRGLRGGELLLGRAAVLPLKNRRLRAQPRVPEPVADGTLGS